MNRHVDTHDFKCEPKAYLVCRVHALPRSPLLFVLPTLNGFIGLALFTGHKLFFLTPNIIGA